MMMVLCFFPLSSSAVDLLQTINRPWQAITRKRELGERIKETYRVGHNNIPRKALKKHEKKLDSHLSRSER